MNKEMNQDIGAIKDDFFKGLTFRECIYGVCAFALGAGGVFVLVFVFGVNVNLAITLCIPVIAAVGLCGFYSRNGMTLPTIIRKKIKLYRQKPLTFCSRQGEKEAAVTNIQAKGIEKFLIHMEERRSNDAKK